MENLSTHLISPRKSGSPPASASVSMPEVQEHRVRQVVEMIDSEPSFSIRDLALKVSLSPAHLQRLFKRETGTQLGSLVSERRLSRAAQLLARSNLSIKEISYRVGYRHHSSFVRAFQRRFAVAPKLYRRKPGIAELTA